MQWVDDLKPGDTVLLYKFGEWWSERTVDSVTETHVMLHDDLYGYFLLHRRDKQRPSLGQFYLYENTPENIERMRHDHLCHALHEELREKYRILSADALQRALYALKEE
jgi:hypothetical protein